MATKIFQMYVEIETHEKVIEALIEGLKQKNPKVILLIYYWTNQCWGAGSFFLWLSAPSKKGPAP